MPQMSPLFWMNLFLLFALLLMFSMVKIYFLQNKSLQKSEKSYKIYNPKNISWTW